MVGTWLRRMAWLASLGLCGCFAVPELDLPLPEAGVEDDGGAGVRDMRRPTPDDGIGFEGADAGFRPDVRVDDGVDAVDLGTGACRVDDDCVLAGAQARCVDARCAIEACAAERYDLDGIVDNGCEYACAPRGDIDGCDARDDDCDGAVDEDAAACDCADRCVGPQAESMCRGDVCVIEACEGATFNGDGRGERGCACDAAGLVPREHPMPRLPPGPVGGRVHYPGDGRPGVAVWFDPDGERRLLAQWFDVEGHPLDEAQTLDDFEEPIELLAISAFSDQPMAVVRAIQPSRTLLRIEPGAREPLVDDCAPERCAVAFTPEGAVWAQITNDGDNEALLVAGESIAEWDLDDGGAGRLMALACLPAAGCIAVVERDQTWLYAPGRGEAFGQRSAVAVTTVGARWAAALGRPGEVRLIRWSPAGGVQDVTLETQPGQALGEIALVEAADGGALLFVDRNQPRTARVAPDWRSVGGLSPTGGFFGVGRVRGDGPGGELYHDHDLRGWRGEEFFFDGVPSGDPLTTSPVAAVRIGDFEALVYRGVWGIFGLPLSEVYAPSLLLSSRFNHDTPPAAARVGDGLLVAEAAEDRIRFALARPAITRSSRPLAESVDPVQTTVTLHATAERTLVGLVGRAANDEPIVGVGRFDDATPLALVREGIVEEAPQIAGPGGPRGALLATRAAFDNGNVILLRRVDDDGALSPAMLGARTFGRGFALAWSPEAERYTLVWIDHIGGDCPGASGDSAWVQTLDADGEAVSSPHGLELPFGCPLDVRLAPGAAGGVHALVTTTGERAALVHLGPDGQPVAPASPVIESDELDEDAALFVSAAGPTAVWATDERAMRVDFACEGP